MARLRHDLIEGRLAATLGAEATTLSFQTVPGLPTITAPDYLPITINDREIVHLTAYTQGEMSGTVVRAQEGTASLLHTSGARWVHGPTTLDFTEPEIVNTIATADPVGATHDISFLTSWHDLTMGEDCVFSFVDAATGRVCSTTVLVRGGFSPTFTAGTTMVWPDATPPSYEAPALFTFLTPDGGDTVYGFRAGKALG